ncbi:TPA: cyclase family protein, partial [Escherichia coli]|nr:cyclase family protein [Escherichia coli]
MHPLAALTQALDSKKVRFVDLTQTLSPSFPALQLPPQFGQTVGFS